MRVAIAGGGIGGMALALSLHDAGIRDVDVYESAPRIKELGVGINLLPHGTRELTELGLLGELYAAGIPTSELVYYSTHGQQIWSEPRGLAAGYRWPQFSIHRGALLGVLYRAVLQRIGLQRVHTAHHLARFGQHRSGVWAEFVDRSTGRTQPRVAADVLVGCDGIHSAVRRVVYPNEPPPTWNGITMWRGVTEGAPFLSGRAMIVAGRFGRQAIAYPISRRHEAGGTALINWVVAVAGASTQPEPTEDWEHIAPAERVIESLKPLSLGFLDIQALIADAGAVYRYPMMDREPLATWNFGRVTLLGDAAHPMSPVGSNGATQAIIDARTLARELAIRPSIPEAIAAYDIQRRPVTTDVVLANRRGGPETCLDIVEQRAPAGFANIESVISREELEGIADRYRRTTGFDPHTLNSRGSLSVRLVRRSANRVGGPPGCASS